MIPRANNHLAQSKLKTFKTISNTTILLHSHNMFVVDFFLNATIIAFFVVVAVEK